jgi:hypothetical protein
VLRGRHHPVLSPGREARPQPLDISVRRPRRHTRRGWVETLARPTKARPGPARRTNEKRVPGRPGIGTLPLRRASARGRPTQHSKETGVTTPTRTRSHTAHTQHTKRRQVQAHKREKFTLSPIRSCSMMASCEQASRTRDNTRTHRAQGRVTARGQAGSKRGDATQNTQMPRTRRVHGTQTHRVMYARASHTSNASLPYDFQNVGWSTTTGCAHFARRSQSPACTSHGFTADAATRMAVGTAHSATSRTREQTRRRQAG